MINVTPRMTYRAKAYLLTRASMLTGLAMALWFTPYGPFGTAHAWVAPFLLCSVLMLWAAHRGKENDARIALLLTVALGASWWGGYVAEWFVQGELRPSGLVMYGGMIAIDLIMLRKPLTTPFEDLTND